MEDSRIKKTGDCTLYVFGPARLLCGAKKRPARRKALALLYYLALEGPSRRETIADMLWNSPNSRANLRAEIYHLRYQVGIDLEKHQDLLLPPKSIGIDRNRAQNGIMEGLEGITPEFDAWLTRKRFELETMSTVISVQELAEKLLEDLPVPGLWVLSGPVGSGIKLIAQALARVLGLPFLEGDAPSQRALLYLEPPFEHAPPLELLLRWPSVLVIERPPFGEDPSLLLQLRASYPVERTRYIETPAMPFTTARKTLLQEYSFVEAARRYLSSHGRWELLEESLRANHDLPLRFRARYRIEARRLPRESRLALERLSICRCKIDNNMLELLGASQQIEELERRRWLIFDDGWRFADPVARRSLAYDLPTGLKRKYHEEAASLLEEEGRLLESAWHRSESGEEVDWRNAGRYAAEYSRAVLFDGLSPFDPPKEFVKIGRESALLMTVNTRGEGLEKDEEDWLILRPADSRGSVWLEWEEENAPMVLRLSGLVEAFSPQQGALEGRPPLELRVGEHTIAFAPVSHPTVLSDGSWLLPMSRLEYSFLIPAKKPLAISSRAAEIAARFRVNAYTLSPEGKDTEVLVVGRTINSPAPETLRAF